MNGYAECMWDLMRNQPDNSGRIVCGAMRNYSELVQQYKTKSAE